MTAGTDTRRIGIDADGTRESTGMRQRILRYAAAAAFLTAAALPARAAELVIGVGDWPSARATAHLVKAIAETRLGATVTLTSGATAELWKAAGAGEIDILPEIWLPNDRAQVAEHVDRSHAVVLLPRGVPARQGLCTTQETAEKFGLTSVDDLKTLATATLLDTDSDGRGEMWIGAEGWNSTRIEQIRARSYGYDRTMTLIEADEPVAMAGLDVASSLGEPIVFFCYEPHHMFTLHDLVMLDEPGHDPTTWTIRSPDEDPDWLAHSTASTAWAVSFIHMAHRAGLESEQPEVTELLARMDLQPDTIEAMTYALIVDRKAPDVFAREWIAANAGRVNGWLGQ
jgi:glycine betaine/proline transport system substrate-binding protein